jgi:hypothetical protein
LRGNLPHHVEATALLTDAILHDDAQRNSIFSIRATYSAAFCRYDSASPAFFSLFFLCFSLLIFIISGAKDLSNPPDISETISSDSHLTNTTAS